MRLYYKEVLIRRKQRIVHSGKVTNVKLLSFGVFYKYITVYLNKSKWRTARTVSFMSSGVFLSACFLVK